MQPILSSKGDNHRPSQTDTMQYEEIHMKKTIAAITLGAVLIPAAVIAGGHYGGHRFERMSEHLQLNEQQQAEVKKIFEEQREERRAMREKTRERISAVLTEEQRAKWDAMRDQRRKRFCGHDGKGHDPHHEHGEGYRHGRDDD